VVLSLRIDGVVMAEQHIKSYVLSNARRVTVKQVSKKVGISESAARNRLDRCKNPDKIFAPQSSNGGYSKKKFLEKREAEKPINNPMYRLMLKTI